MPVQHSHQHNRHIHSYLKHAAPHRHGAPPTTSWTIPDLCKAYTFPIGTAPNGGNIYIVELGGGWHQADVAAAFAAMNLPAPNITDLSADGTTTNTPGSDADGEVALDIQCAGGAYALATGKPANIFMVWGSDIAACLTFAAAHAHGPVLPFAASGDNNSSDGGPTPANVDCPASCPSVIGCGGTSKPLNGPEVVWNDNPGSTDGSGTGGGYSTIFAAEPWQLNIPPAPKAKHHGPSSRALHHGDATLGRMVPDVAANADPQTGYQIVLDGKVQVFGGTSAVAPLYAGLFASFGVDVFSCSWGADEADWETQKPGSCAAMEAAALAAVGSLQHICPDFYENSACFTDITQGSNGMYDAGPGPDPCTGMGAPLGTALMELLEPTLPAAAWYLIPRREAEHVKFLDLVVRSARPSVPNLGLALRRHIRIRTARIA